VAQHFLRKTSKPKVKEELIEGVLRFWRTQMSVAKYNRYIDHLQKVIRPENMKISTK
jgi:CRISPR/Cas system CMR-associated protein Cmr1 (group 7 of RAMP superfamily)